MKRVIPLLLLLCIGTSQAASRYITDHTRITLRSGEGTSHRILSMLPSGEQVELLKSNMANGYSHIRTKGGKTGYVLTRQLSKIPSAKERLAIAERQLTITKEQASVATARLGQLEKKHLILLSQHGRLQKSDNGQRAELLELKQVSAGAVRTARERKELLKQVASMTWELENLKQENLELKNDSSHNWFLTGAFVIILGIGMGMILPRLQSRRRKQPWNSL